MDYVCIRGVAEIPFFPFNFRKKSFISVTPPVYITILYLTALSIRFKFIKHLIHISSCKMNINRNLFLSQINNIKSTYFNTFS